MALPLMITNSVLDYYYGWESRVLEKETQKIEKIKDDAFKYHSHHFLDSYYVTKDVDGNTINNGDNHKLDYKKYLENADSGNYHEKTKSLVTTGPTGTNVMDLILAIKK